MIRFKATRLVRNFNEIEGLLKSSDWTQMGNLVADVVADVTQMTRDLDLGDQLIAQAERVRGRQRGGCDEAEMRILLMDLSAAIQVALIKPSFFIVNERDARYFDLIDSKPKILKKLDRAARNDLDEAAKCLALDRFTASVILSMRVVERIQRKLARELAVELPNGRSLEHTNMDGIYKAVKRKLEEIAGQPRSTQRAQAEKFYSNLSDQCLFFKQLRNEASHARNSYGPDQARDVLKRVVDFVKLLGRMRP